MALDLANDIIRDTYRGKKSNCLRLLDRDPNELRRAIANARRFVLDESMSEFLAQLVMTPFSVAVERRIDVLDSLRHSARLPFPKMFVQYDNIAFRRSMVRIDKGKTDFWGETLIGPPAEKDEDWPEWASQPADITAHIAYLLEQDSNDDNLIWITEFTSMQEEGTTLPLPVTYAYRTDEAPLNPRHKLNTDLALFAHGLIGADTRASIGLRVGDKYAKQIASRPADWTSFQSPTDNQIIRVPKIIPEFGGIVRYVICFIATLVDCPTVHKEVRPAKTYFAESKVRKYLEYTTVTLNLPRKTTMKTLAMRLVAKARRGWHEVIPHWRVNHPKLGQVFCASRDKHLWNETDSTGHATCKQCDARRVYIVLPTGRGDPMISVRVHPTRNVTHHE